MTEPAPAPKPNPDKTAKAFLRIVPYMLVVLLALLIADTAVRLYRDVQPPAQGKIYVYICTEAGECKPQVVPT